MSSDAVPHLWTAWADYSATGEGRTLMLRINYAVDADEARQKFEQQFGSYFVRACETEVGVVSNEVTTYLLSPAALRFASTCKGNLDVVASFHVNFS